MGKEPDWERTFYNSYGNYTGYRFQDFRSGCPHRRKGEMAGDCAHPDNECSNSNGELAECLCDFCPCVEKDYDDEDPNEPDYSEGEQPILVIETPNAKVSGTP